MTEYKTNMETAIKALEEFYQKHGAGKTMEYTYGFFDALAILKELVTENDKSCRIRTV